MHNGQVVVELGYLVDPQMWQGDFILSPPRILQRFRRVLA